MSVAFDGMDNLVVTFRCSGTALGWQELMTNGSQGLRTVTTGEAG